MTTPTARIGVPFWNAVLSALGSLLVGFIGGTIAVVIVIYAIVLATGNAPSNTPGHPLTAAAEVALYVFGGAFAYWRLRVLARTSFRAVTSSDARVIGLGVLALIVVRIGTGVQLVLTNQTKHVQSGLEHFDVVSKDPTITTLSIVLTVLSLVVLAPIVEEIVFRGLLFGALAPRLGIVLAALISALIFGAAHGDVVLFPALAALGLIAAFAYAATANLWVSIILHALNNALGAIVLIYMSLHHITR